MAVRPDATAVLRGAAPWPVQVAAYALLAQFLLRTSLSDTSGMDDLLVVRAVRQVLDGVSPYAGDRFLYPPSSVPFALLQAPVPDPWIRVVAPWVCALLLLGGWWAALRLVDVRLRSWLGTLGVAASVAFIPATHLIALGSWTAAVACLTGVALLLMGRGRWLLAGLVVGLSIAIKPMLMPLGLVFLLARRWGGFAAAAGLPLLLSAAVLPLLPDPGLFFTKTVPFLLGGQDDFARLYDGSLPAVLPRFGVPEGPVVTAARGVVAVLTLAVAVLRWRRGDDRRLRIVETSTVLMTGTFLVMSPSFDHYAMVVVPALVATVVLPGAVTRTVWFWITLLPFARFIGWALLDFAHHGNAAHRQVFKMVGWNVTVLALLAATTWTRRLRGHRAPAGGSAPAAGEEPPTLPEPRRTGPDRATPGRATPERTSSRHER